MNLETVIVEPRRTDRDLDLLQTLRRRESLAAESLIGRFG